MRAFPRVLGAVNAARSVAYLFSSRGDGMGAAAIRELRAALEMFFPEDSEHLESSQEPSVSKPGEKT